MSLQKWTKNLALTIWIAILPMLTIAQENSSPAMADKFRSEGKIYVVVLVIATIFIGIIWYLISLDKKISRIEKNISSNHS